MEYNYLDEKLISQKFNRYYTPQFGTYLFKYRDIFTNKIIFVTTGTMNSYITYIKRLLAYWYVLYENNDINWVNYANILVNQTRRDLILENLSPQFRHLLDLATNSLILHKHSGNIDILE